MPDETPAKLRLKVLTPGPGPEREHSAAHDVHAILQANLRSEKSLKVNQPMLVTKKKSRRLRDYLVSLIGGNLFIVILTWVVGANVVSLLFGLAGMVLLSCGLTWVMFQIMEDY